MAMLPGFYVWISYLAIFLPVPRVEPGMLSFERHSEAPLNVFLIMITYEFATAHRV